MMEVGMTPHSAHTPSTLTLGVRVGEGRRRVYTAPSGRIFCDNGNILLSVLPNMVATDHIKYLKLLFNCNSFKFEFIQPRVISGCYIGEVSHGQFQLTCSTGLLASLSWELSSQKLVPRRAADKASVSNSGLCGYSVLPKGLSLFMPRFPYM